MLEYADEKGDKDVTGLFRTAQSGNPVYHLMPRRLDYSHDFFIQLESSGQSVRMTGAELKQRGIAVRLDENLTSEMLIFTAQ